MSVLLVQPIGPRFRWEETDIPKALYSYRKENPGCLGEVQVTGKFDKQNKKKNVEPKCTPHKNEEKSKSMIE